MPAAERSAQIAPPSIREYRTPLSEGGEFGVTPLQPARAAKGRGGNSFRRKGSADDVVMSCYAVERVEEGWRAVLVDDIGTRRFIGPMFPTHTEAVLYTFDFDDVPQSTTDEADTGLHE